MDLLPTFVGTASPSNGSLAWKGACFYDNTAWLEFHNETGSEFGGGTLHIKVSKALSWTCMDIYVFATPYRVTWDYYFLSREHTFQFKEWKGKAEFEYKSNVGFLKKHMGASFEQHPQPWVTNISIDDIHSGDFLAISKIRGRWGGFETLEKWVSGTYAGHTAVCLRDSEGKLWVGESRHDNEELNKDDSNPHIALLLLHPDMLAKFNETAAWEYAESMNGKPYGYHNMLFSWMDTINANYPWPLDAHVVQRFIVSLWVASVMTVWNQMQPTYAANMWNEAINKRLGTEGLNLPDLIVETEMRGSSFAKLLTIPEQDDWLYSDRMSASCVAFVLEIYRAVGLFDPISSFIQIKDANSLRFFENNSSRLPKWCNDGDDIKLPFSARIQYNGPVPHMNETCPSLPPKYLKPSDC
ncbi:hypothetical protein ACJRO7_022960 [Eucalyptus globulus]|uniref:Uncharacterized protein n=1 Tax=Eucalyptus globulus TaxID=34317 RepID=A0ABD3K593_EUCGL